MDLGELRKTVLALLVEDRVDIPWEHIFGESHRFSSDEVRLVLEDGAYEFHETVEGRYVATYRGKGAPVALSVFFELEERSGAIWIRVLTAFPAGFRRRRRRWRRRR